MEVNVIPNNLDEAIDTLLGFYANEIEDIKTMSESEFMVSSHFGAGMFIRNSWNLWWQEGHGYDSWPQEKPELTKYFESIKIVHADDMSSIILSSLYRHIHDLPYDLEGQIKVFHDHWKNQGFKDGIPKS